MYHKELKLMNFSVCFSIFDGKGLLIEANIIINVLSKKKK